MAVGADRRGDVKQECSRAEIERHLAALNRATEQICELTDPGITRSRRLQHAFEPCGERADAMARELFEGQRRYGGAVAQADQSGERRERTWRQCCRLRAHEAEHKIEDRMLELVRALGADREIFGA